MIRNNGECWGRITLPNGAPLDVVTISDHYDQSDEDAFDAFERAMKRPRCVYLADSWL